MKSAFRKLAVWAAAGSLAVASSGSSAWAFAKPKPAPPAPPKKIITLDPIQNVSISIPQTVDLSNPNAPVEGASSYDFGPNLENALANQMVSSGRYILSQAELTADAERAQATAKDAPPSPVQWDGSSVVPVASFKFYVDALVFRSGGRGDGMYYGFDERFRTPFNDGLNRYPEEFPLSQIEFQPDWFDAAFNDRGGAPFDSQEGLDLGEGFSFDFLLAFVTLKYASYHSAIRMRAEMDSPLTGRYEMKPIQVAGNGFFFDIVGGFLQYSGGIGLAHADAMSNAYNAAFAGAFGVIDRWVSGLPLTAKVFSLASATQIYLNTGENSNVPIGTLFTAVNNPSLVFQVSQVVASGSIAELTSGDVTQVEPGMILVQQSSGGTAPTAASAASRAISSSGEAAQPEVTPVAAESVTLPSQNLPQSNFAGNGFSVQTDFFTALLDSIIGLPLLPYRIWRYLQYDQSYQPPAVSADAAAVFSAAALNARDATDPSPSLAPDMSTQDGAHGNTVEWGAVAWAHEQIGQPWAHQIGLDKAAPMTQSGPIVAVIDSGVDYTHPALSDCIWINPAPVTDADGNTDLYGWDFISGDPRPYDDGYHGTEVASALVAVAPLVQVMPLKVFNPWGVTSSAAIYGAFQYAVDHGAKIILAAWATRLNTQTLQMAVQYAHDHGVLVVTSAGDRGDNLATTPAYPAALSATLDNVLAVTGVDGQDQLVTVYGSYANYDPAIVGIAAPGESINVADPRGHTSQETSTGIAAAIVTGAIARNWAASGGAGTYPSWIADVKAQAEPVPGLLSSVQGGLRVRIK